MPRWQVNIVRNKPEHLGIVTACDAQEALNRAASLLRIDPAHCNRLIIKKIDDFDLGRDTD